MKLVCFDCDSTLSAIEGIEELARLRQPEVLAQVEAMTSAAMNGSVPIEEVFGRRLDIVRPTATDAAAIGRRYVETIEPTAEATVARLRLAGWTCAIVSGGFRQAIQPLADRLAIDRIEAVDLHFGADGGYAGFDAAAPTSRSGGKPEVMRRLREEFKPERLIMVGDGVSDLEAKPAVDLFVGFGRYVTRERVQREAAVFIHSLDALVPLLG
jgi:phosphoserine phosphatase